MASTDYTFFNMSRVGEDDTCNDQRDIQNTMFCNYTMNNFATDYNLSRTKQLATSQPGVMYNGTSQLSPGGGNIDDSTKILYDIGVGRPSCKLNLFTRPYVTVPSLKRGYGNPVLEADMLQGEQSISKKIHNDTKQNNISLSELNYTNYTQIPLIPDKQKIAQNPTNLVEEKISNKWIRGGISSRDLSKDAKNYVSY